MSMFRLFHHVIQSFSSRTGEFDITRVQESCTQTQECVTKALEMFFETMEEPEPVKTEWFKQYRFQHIFLNPPYSSILIMLQFIVICWMARPRVVDFVKRLWTVARMHVTMIKEFVDDIRYARAEARLALKRVETLEKRFNLFADKMCDLVEVLFEYRLKELDQEGDMQRRTEPPRAANATTGEGPMSPIRRATSDSQISHSTNDSVSVPPSTILRPSVSALAATPCRIPIFEDSPKPINPRKIRRYNGSAIPTISLSGVQRYSDAGRRGRPTRIPLFANSPKPINVARFDA